MTTKVFIYPSTEYRIIKISSPKNRSLDIFHTNNNLNFLLFFGLIQYLVPYVYFRFQLGPLCFKNFNLVSYVCFRFQFGPFR
jgi:hypothetical protein